MDMTEDMLVARFTCRIQKLDGLLGWKIESDGDILETVSAYDYMRTVPNFSLPVMTHGFVEPGGVHIPEYRIREADYRYD